jgi:hypothetical protein
MNKLIIPGETQPGKLIVPGAESTPLFKPNRRGFMGVLAAAFTGTVVAPMIVPYTSLMKIDTRTNRLVFAFTGGEDNEEEYIRSVLNLSECLDPFVRAQWEGQHQDLTYDLVREGDIPAKFEHRWGQTTYINFYTKRRDEDMLKESIRRIKYRVASFKEGRSSYI